MLNKKFYTITIIVLLIFISAVSFADDSLRITRWTVNSALAENGDLLVSEDITFDFKDKFNGVYRDIVLNGTGGISDLEVYEMAEGVEMPYTLVTSSQAQKGSKGIFAATEKENSLEIKIFSPSKDEQKTFRIKYTVKNVAIKHIDTGELYYKFLGSENSTPIEFFSASVRLPGKDRENTKIFAHGPLNGNINFKENDLVKLEVSDVPTNTFIEARILFPNSFIETSKNKGNKIFKSIMDEEISFIEASQKKAESRAKNKKLFNNISLIVSSLGIATTGFIFNKLRRNIDIYDSLNSINPEDITPAELRMFMTSVIDSRALMTTIFDFARKEYLTIDEIEGSKKKKKDFQFSKTIRPRNDLLSHEEFLLDWLFNTIGDGNVVSTKDIENYRKKNLNNFSKDFMLWQKKVKTDIKNREYYDDSAIKWGFMILIISIISFTIGIIAVIFESLYGIILLILSIFFFVYSMILFFRKSDKGYVEYQLWKDFKKDLECQGVSFEDYNINITADKVLIYALALGLPMKTMDNFREKMHEYNTPTHWSYWYFMTNRRGGSSFEDRFNSSFYGSSTSTTSSSVGGGGGFSGGGGGGAGGGGAGGF